MKSLIKPNKQRTYRLITDYIAEHSFRRLNYSIQGKKYLERIEEDNVVRGLQVYDKFVKNQSRQAKVFNLCSLPADTLEIKVKYIPFEVA